MKLTLNLRANLICDAYSNWITEGDRVLDVGCGNGIVANKIRNKFKCAVTGTDILDYLNIKMPFLLMREPYKLPFESASFDTILFNDVLHHINDQEKILKEAARVANKLLIFELKPSPLAYFIDKFINKLHNSDMATPFNFKTKEHWQKFFSELGFDYEFRKVKKPFYYPLKHYAFAVKNVSKS